jgi:hypothetical protein
VASRLMGELSARAKRLGTLVAACAATMKHVRVHAQGSGVKAVASAAATSGVTVHQLKLLFLPSCSPDSKHELDDLQK